MITKLSPDTAHASSFNIPIPTFGGLQFWRDVYVHPGWRIQMNVVTGHHRLLDPGNTRHDWGSWETTKQRFDALKAAREITPQSSHLVILVHGIARSTGTFSKMAPRLRDEGYDVAVISYPSTRTTIEAHAEGLATLLNRLEETQTVSFVTHSMGGLVIRHLLAFDRPWKNKVRLGRVVMIAPPNQGSAVALALKNFAPYRLLYGKPGQQLTPGVAREIPVPEIPFAIIAGGKSDNQGFNPFIDGDDDGTVKVCETELKCAVDTLIVPALHGQISKHPHTIAATIRYLETGGLAAKIRQIPGRQ